ncbi:MAG: MOSC domain-containing protein [Microthrixaceae bacterium]
MTELLVTALWRYPFKSTQGAAHDVLDFTEDGIVGDRIWALRTPDGHLCSAKRYSAMLMATGHDDGTVTTPQGDVLRSDAEMSTWMGRAVRRIGREDNPGLPFEMTFDPPNDDAEMVEIPSPPAALVDDAHVHLLSTSTLRWCATRRPDLDWDPRRFRPNLLLDHTSPDEADAFVEDTWIGSEVTVGETILYVEKATVRCAMPLRAQPRLRRQAALFAAMDELHANHLGVYARIVRPGRVRIGDAVKPSTT